MTWTRSPRVAARNQAQGALRIPLSDPPAQTLLSRKRMVLLLVLQLLMFLFTLPLVTLVYQGETLVTTLHPIYLWDHLFTPHLTYSPICTLILCTPPGARPLTPS
uniref:Uncharacterized protein n=1 Tax=Cacopsylla melanoneura TaxID=428564 RepID=A0A8D9EUF1_9HEMI